MSTAGGCLPAGDGTVGPGLAAPDEDTIFQADDDLSPPESYRISVLDLVAFPAELADEKRVKGSFYLKMPAVRPLPSGRVQGHLRVHMEIYHVRRSLHLPLRLHIHTHDAERPDCLSVLRDKSRDDRVVGPLPRHEVIDVFRVEGEIRAAVLQSR